METDNSFPWISSLGAKKVLGTMAGTTVLCTQYFARVTKKVVPEVSREVRVGGGNKGDKVSFAGPH